VRLFLDAHISSRVIAHELRLDGHDVLAADESDALQKANDEALLEMAAREERIFVTCDIADFPDLTREWASMGRHHSGCIVLAGVGHRQFGVILRLLRAQVERSPEQLWYHDLLVIMGPGSFG
jgi:predicted nuclease of predicted toxin-antitoxin system